MYNGWEGTKREEREAEVKRRRKRRREISKGRKREESQLRKETK